MGIADFGTTDTGGSTYYETTAFRGTISIASLSTYNSLLGGGASSMSFQLNVELGFEDSGSWYVYWVQDVAFVDTSANTLSIENNIWNWSSGSAVMESSSVSGNGSIQMGYYAVGVGSSVPLQYPSTLVLLVNTSVNGLGKPVVRFMYDRGGGLTTYDTVSFIFADHLDYSDGFIVDGQLATPSGYAYDAELILGGPGGGSTTVLGSGSSVDLSLEYWNGRNYQSVSDAENFGGNTGETVSNAISSGMYYTSSGELFDEVTAGTGGLGWLWSAEQVSSAEMTGPNGFSGAMLDGGYNVPYLYGLATVTLFPGTYSFFADAAGTTESCGSYSLTASTTTGFGCPTYYSLNFGESGLPTGTDWTVTVGSQVGSSSGPIVMFYEPNGPYDYSVGGIDGYHADHYSGSVDVQSSSAAVALTWIPFVFSITFSETGLPVGTPWTVTISGGQPQSSATPDALVMEQNGSYSYTIGGISGYRPDRYVGTVRVAGSAANVVVRWSQVTYVLSLVESGLPNGTLWSAMIGTVSGQSTNNSMTFIEPNGSFTYVVDSLAGYHLPSYSGTLRVDGQPTTARLVWGIFQYEVTFAEVGLPLGLNWSVTFANQTHWSGAGQIVFESPNGSAGYSITAPDGFRISPGSGVVSVSGAAVTVNLSSTQNQPGFGFGSAAVLNGALPFVLVAAGLGVAAVASAALLRRRRRTKRQRAPPPGAVLQ